MDRALAASVQYRNRLRRVAAVGLPVVVAGTLVTNLPEWLRPTLQRARIRTAAVTMGSVETVITATGLVAPELERVLSSPLDARVLRILERPGAAVRRGDPVVELDVGESVLALETILKDLEIKDNEQAQARLALDKALTELDSRIELKTLEHASLQARLDGHRQLSTEGLLSRELFRESELAVELSRIELVQLEAERRSTERATDLQLHGLDLQRVSLRKQAGEARRLLDLATTKSDRDGVLTWVLPEEGALVRRGDVIARIADLSSFRVDASVSDVHAGRVRTGLPVIVQVGDDDLAGAIAEVSPTVDNGIIRFTVTLDERSHARLRPNLRADVLVVAARRERVRRVERGPFADGGGAGGAHHAFVMRGGRAIRTPVVFGLAGFDAIEVVTGLNEGDEVVISDMRDYLHLEEVKIR